MSAAHFWFRATEMEMSTACISHMAVRGPIDHRRFNLNLLTLCKMYCGIQSSRHQSKPLSFTWLNAPQFVHWSGPRVRSAQRINRRRSFPAIVRVSQLQQDYLSHSRCFCRFATGSSDICWQNFCPKEV